MNESFDDPQLKQAVRRVWSGEKAPAALRGRIEGLFTSQAANPVVAADSRSWANRWKIISGPVLGLALAASVLIALGVMLPRAIESKKPALAESPLPNDIAASFVKTHDGCCTLHDHHLIGSDQVNDYKAIGEKLAGDLRIPVISTALVEWRFMGAGPCPVWGHESGHLLYRRHSQTLSVFTIPVADMGLQPNDGLYSAEINGHHISAFVKDNGLYCVVAYAKNGGVTANDARHLRDHLRDSFSTLTFTAAPSRDSFAGR